MLEVARTLLIHIKVSKYFWSDGVLIACYLINRMPSILGGQIMYYLLYPHKELFNLPLKIFGCIYFAHDNRSDRTKLDPKALKCVFLGYSKTHKGYKYYCSGLNKLMTCADVTLFESKYYFESESSVLRVR